MIACAKETHGVITSDLLPNIISSKQESNPTGADNSVTYPSILLIKFGDYGPVYDFRAFTNNPREFLKIVSEIRKRIYDSFQQRGIDLTVPKAQLNIGNGNDNKDKFNNSTEDNNLEEFR